MVGKKKRWGGREERERESNREGETETERSQTKSGMRSRRQQGTETGGETQKISDEERDTPERGKKVGGRDTEGNRQRDDIIETLRK